MGRYKCDHLEHDADNLLFSTDGDHLEHDDHHNNHNDDHNQ